MSPHSAHDAATLAFYDSEAAVYLTRGGSASRALNPFLARLAAGASILELGCGGGRDTAAMIAQGFRVTPTDGSPGMVLQAEARLGIPVHIMRFDELDIDEVYDAVWANACLLHAPERALPDILARIHRSLRPGGLFYASFKTGDGGGRDSLGRYNNFPTLQTLDTAYAASGPWTERTVQTQEGGGYDDVTRVWAQVTARRG